MIHNLITRSRFLRVDVSISTRSYRLMEIERSNLTEACSYGEIFSRLPGKISRCDVNFVKCKQKVFPLSGKVVFLLDKNNLGHRDLACQQARSRYPVKLCISSPRKPSKFRSAKKCRPKSDLGRHVSAFKICFHVLEH